MSKKGGTWTPLWTDGWREALMVARLSTTDHLRGFETRVRARELAGGETSMTYGTGWGGPQ